uniref:Putative secretory peptide-3 n=1 Tax=Pleurobrachia bachei TaxID=34499 RepID=M4H1Q3_PLEBA|nr:putative secretory peptide-3 [Pleurobrachia bachei]|eukprot:sb/3469468/
MRCFVVATFLLATITAWSPVEQKIQIPFDLESTPLQIKTNSLTGSGEMIRVVTFTADGKVIGAVEMWFKSSVKYKITGSCKNWYSLFPVQPPEEVDKTWTIRKNTTTLSIECNGVEVLNYQFSDSNDSSCVERWGGDVVELIKFSGKESGNEDTASDTYRAKPKVCPGFTVDGSVQGIWNDTDPGQTVTINCQKSSFERTCTDNGEWSTDIPTCEKQSKSNRVHKQERF